MSFPGLSLRVQTILVTSLSLLILHLVSLSLYLFLSAESITLERETLLADRIVAGVKVIERALPDDRLFLAQQLSGDKFLVTIDDGPVDKSDEQLSGPEITALINEEFVPFTHIVLADYVATELSGVSRNLTAQRITGAFRIHETLIVSVDLPEGKWINFQVSGSPWSQMLPTAALPSLTLIALGVILLAAWFINWPLRSLSTIAKASKSLADNVLTAEPLAVNGPIEIKQVSRAFNTMQRRVQRLLKIRNDMLGAISHDFRTPLTRLRLRVEQLPSDSQRNKAIKDIEDMEALIHFTLDFVKNQNQVGPVETVELSNLIGDVLSQLAFRDQKISVDVDDDIVVTVDTLGIKRVLMNLVQNALFYASCIHISAHRSSDALELRIEDNGPGISAEQRVRAFTPFLRLDTSRGPNTGGVGLGLSIAHTIVKANKGTIQLGESQKLGGLEVNIFLPVKHHQQSETA